MTKASRVLLELTIEGRTFRGKEILEKGRQLVQEHHDAPWARKVLDALQEIVGDGDTIRSMVLHTSGTTGTPKPIALSAADLIASAELTASVFDLQRGDRVLMCLPANHIAGRMMLVRAIHSGLDLHFTDPAGGVLQQLAADDRFSFSAMIPLQLHRALLQDPRKVDQHFTRILLGGGPVDLALVQLLKGRSIKVFQGYGSTETVTHVALRQLDPDRPEPLKEPYKAVGEVRFSNDPEGRLVVHTPHLSTIVHHTNDIVEVLDPVRFIWKGRWDNVVLSGGKKYHPEIMEARTSGSITEPHYFTGEKDPLLGEALVLVVESNEPSSRLFERLRPLLEELFHQHEVPKRLIALPRLPRTGSGKLIRRPPSEITGL